jgi:hypothetical protein
MIISSAGYGENTGNRPFPKFFTIITLSIDCAKLHHEFSLQSGGINTVFGTFLKQNGLKNGALQIVIPAH